MIKQVDDVFFWNHIESYRLKITNSANRVKHGFMRQNNSVKKLSKFASYILGRRPDEFGLVPDTGGYVKIKDFLKALNEEDGWRYVRRHHLNEIIMTLPAALIEIKDTLIRAAHREKLSKQTPAEKLPKLLYTCIRSRAYPAVLNKGALTAGHSRIILTATPELAEKIGRRMDPMPVLLTIQSQKSIARGVVFYTAGDSIFLADSIPEDCYTGPALPKQKPVPSKEPVPGPHETNKLSGSFLMDLSEEKLLGTSLPRRKKKKEIAWKKDRRALNRREKKMGPV